jgi:GH15 family glucan-1,4-alpha-glucosidase
MTEECFSIVPFCLSSNKCQIQQVKSFIQSYESEVLDKVITIFEGVMSFSNHPGMFSEEITISGEKLWNTPQAFSHLAFVSATYNLNRVNDA